MASSDPWMALATQEATRVEEQARNMWGALRIPLGERFETAKREAEAEAAGDHGPLTSVSLPGVRLAHAHWMLLSAQRHFKKLQKNESQESNHVA